LLGVHWWQLAGWRWLFILEGIPAILFGIVTVFYLTDRPAQARWLRHKEQRWLIGQLQDELEAKKKIRDYTILQAFRDKQVLLLIATWFLASCGFLGNVYWLPTFVKRLSGFSDRTVTILLMIPALITIVGMLINGWHSDKSGERRLHATAPLLIAAAMYTAVITSRHHAVLPIVFLLLGSGFLQMFYPVFWSIPTMILSQSAAAASFGLINAIGQVGGFAGPYIVGLLNDGTHALAASFGFIALVYFAAASLMLSLKLRDPIQVAEGVPSG
jgi:predicted MFS family arabinose efflux permease